MDIVYRHIEFVTWILSIVTSLLSIVTLLLSIIASMLSHVHHRIARPLGPPYLSTKEATGVANHLYKVHIAMYTDHSLTIIQFIILRFS